MRRHRFILDQVLRLDAWALTVFGQRPARPVEIVPEPRKSPRLTRARVACRYRPT